MWIVEEKEVGSPNDGSSRLRDTICHDKRHKVDLNYSKW